MKNSKKYKSTFSKKEKNLKYNKMMFSQNFKTILKNNFDKFESNDRLISSKFYVCIWYLCIYEN